MAVETAFLNSAPEIRSEGGGGILENYSVEVTARDRASLELAPDILRPRSEVFVTALPKDHLDDLVKACARVRAAGLTPVPHMVARNVPDQAALDSLVGRLAQDAGVDRCLVLGGDRDKPVGRYESGLQILQTGLLPKHGINSILIGCYPEGHSKISEDILDKARADKLQLAEDQGLAVALISQFCFDSAPVISFARRIRRDGVRAPFRVGVAGPASRSLLLKYALICGVGNSLRVLKNRSDLARNALGGETPEILIRDLAEARSRETDLGLSGIHFFPFGSLAKSVQWADTNSY